MKQGPFDAPIYVGDKEPEQCTVCGKKGDKLKILLRGVAECSHIECPIRKRVSAQPREQLRKGEHE